MTHSPIGSKMLNNGKFMHHGNEVADLCRIHFMPEILCDAIIAKRWCISQFKESTMRLGDYHGGGD